jgi:hypothetical protein
MSEVQTTPRRETLFSIEAELLGLLDQRADALERLAMSWHPMSSGVENMPQVIEEEIAVIDGLIRDYVSREVKKVDNIAWAVKDLRAKSAAKKQQADELYAKSKADEETADCILQFSLEVLQQSGSKREEGKLFKLTRQGNGGAQALTIAQPDLVPDKFKRVRVVLSLAVWSELVKDYPELEYVTPKPETEPDNGAIRSALQDGEGVMGCRLEERAEHIRIK